MENDVYIVWIVGDLVIYLKYVRMKVYFKNLVYFKNIKINYLFWYGI